MLRYSLRRLTDEGEVDEPSYLTGRARALPLGGYVQIAETAPDYDRLVELKHVGVRVVL